MTTAAAAPFRSFSLQVAGTRRLGPSPARVAFTGADLHAFRPGGRRGGGRRRRVTFVGYRRRGLTEGRLREQL